MACLRVVLDTNVLVSGLVYPAGISGRIVGAWRQGSLELVLSRYILVELVKVLSRLSRNSFSAAEIQDLVDSSMFKADIVDPASGEDAALRDPADNAILGTLLAAKADYLITGDKDLSALATRYPILTPAAFWARHG